jgi:hypothetical protein
MAFCLQLDDVWQLFARLRAEKSRALTKLVGPALQVEKSEAGGGLICWGRKKKYVWQQQATNSF